MAAYAIIENGIIINIIESDEHFAKEIGAVLLPTKGFGIGDLYIGNEFKMMQSPELIPEPLSSCLEQVPPPKIVETDPQLTDPEPQISELQEQNQQLGRQLADLEQQVLKLQEQKNKSFIIKLLG